MLQGGGHALSRSEGEGCESGEAPRTARAAPCAAGWRPPMLPRTELRAVENRTILSALVRSASGTSQREPDDR